MKPLVEFICKPLGGTRYASEKELGGKMFTVNVDADDHRYSNRFAVVVERPHNYHGPVQKGDTLLVHHNVFKFYTGSKGREMSGKSFLKDDLFLIDSMQMYAYIRNGIVNMLPGYNLVEPIKYDHGLSVDIKGNTPLYGKLFKCSDHTIYSELLFEDEIVIFTPDSEYEFEIDGKIYYRVMDQDIAVHLNGKG